MNASLSLPAKLRPAKVRSAVRRRVFERSLRRVEPARRLPMEKLGGDYGAWHIPLGAVQPDWTCYCVGAGSDVSLERELLRRHGVTVRSFDPFEVWANVSLEELGTFPRYSFHVVAIAAEDGPLRMRGRQDHEHGSVSAAGLHEGDEFVMEGRSLESIAAELGDPRVDLLKLDIEGSEYDVLAATDLDALGVQVLCVELHHTSSPRRAHALLESLDRRGFDVVHVERPSDFTLLRRP